MDFAVSFVDEETLIRILDYNLVYSFLQSLPSFTYIIMGNIILLFIIELIVQNLPKPHQNMAQSHVIMAKRKNFLNIVKAFVVLEIVFVMSLFLTVLILRLVNKNHSDIKVMRQR
jgi:hypothetical protein